jgi:hypothetical protein
MYLYNYMHSQRPAPASLSNGLRGPGPRSVWRKKQTETVAERTEKKNTKLVGKHFATQT